MNGVAVAASPDILTSTAPAEPPRRWFGLALLFFAQMIAIGSITYGFSVLLKPLAQDFELSRADVNQGLMVVLVGMATFSPLIGRALDRLPGKHVIAAGGTLFAAGWLVIASTANVWVALLAAFFLLAPGGAALGPVSAMTLVSRWFVERRGLAIGIVSMATSAGGLIIVPVIAFLLDMLGWRSAMITFGLIASAVLVIPAWFLMPERAASPAGGSQAANSQAGSSAHAHGEAAPAVWKQRDFWLIALALGIVMSVNGAFLSCIVAHATDKGLSLAQATAIISTLSGSAALGKLVIGALTDRVDPRWLFIVVALVNVCLLMVVIAWPTYPYLLLGAALSGPALGGIVPLWTVLVGRRFGLAQMGRAMGVMSSAIMPINLLALYLVGSLFDATGSYVAAFELFMLCLGISVVAILPVRGLSRPR